MEDTSKQAKDKIIVVVGCPGVGKATTIGNMIYQCGGIDMLTLETFERSSVRKYDQIVKELEKLGRRPSFNTPKNKVVIADEQTVDADCVILVVAPNEGSATEQDQNRFKNLAPLFDAKKAIVLINKLDEHSWSKEVFTEAVERTITNLQNLGIATQSTPFIPISGLRGDNLVVPSNKTPWHFSEEAMSPLNIPGGVTLLSTIDMVLA